MNRFIASDRVRCSEALFAVRRHKRKAHHRFFTGLLFSLFVFASSCKSFDKAELELGDKVDRALAETLSPEFTPGKTEAFYSWVDESGKVQSHSDPEKVPEKNRQLVRISLLDPDSPRPKEGQFWTTDLRESKKSRYLDITSKAVFFEKGQSLREADEAQSLALHRAAFGEDLLGDIVLYGASWCSACRAMSQLLDEKKIVYKKLDIEKDPGADQAMAKLLEANARSKGGIPVLQFGGRIMVGFQSSMLNDWLVQRAAKQEAAQNKSTESIADKSGTPP